MYNTYISSRNGVFKYQLKPIEDFVLGHDLDFLWYHEWKSYHVRPTIW